jgi:hypothetical protein
MNNPPAFPYTQIQGSMTYTGMSLRDYFAAKVLPQCFEVSTTTDIAAKEAYRMADAMLKAREENGSN